MAEQLEEGRDVVLERDIGQGIPVGTPGTIVRVNNPLAADGSYDVEFETDAGRVAISSVPLDAVSARP